MTIDRPKVMTLTEVATALWVRRAVAWRLVKSGKLRSFRVGKAYRVLRENLERFTKGGE